ncbi:glycosyltransferase family 39 protein [Streptomyces sp. NPDC048664]|uniref:glycosyltransferase family 39 protein n=1 Tax=Streptomyces sp. NPDC048664 TaxID=3154505 RepID=UPI003434C71B
MSRSPERRRERVAVLLPASVMFAIGLWGLDRGGMWRDEAATFDVARRPVPQIWHLLHTVDAVHGFYYLMMRPILAVHPGEVMLRLPSVCGAALAAGLVAALGTRLARPRVGLWAGLLYAVTPMVGHYAQEGRSYALVAAGVAGATLLLVRAVRGGRWWPYGTVVAVTCVLHEFAVLALLAHACTLALARVPGRVWRGWLAAAGAAVLVLLPLALVSHGQAAQVAWLRKPDVRSAESLLREFTGPSWTVLVPCLLLAALALAPRRPAPAWGRGVTLAGVALPLVVVPPAVLMAVSRVSPLYYDRYVLYALAGAPLLAAAGADRMAGAARRLRTGAPRRPWTGGSRASTALPGRHHPDEGVPLGHHSDPPRGGAPGPAGSHRPLLAHVPRPARPADAGGHIALRDAPPAPAPGAAAAVRRLSPVRRDGTALLGVLAVCAVFAVHLPVLRADRLASHRPDDLAAVSAFAGGRLRPGDPVLFLPSMERRTALTYPAGFAGTRDVALDVPAAEDGSLYGRETGPRELRRRLDGLTYVWVVARRFALRGSWTPTSPTESAKLAVLRRDFRLRQRYTHDGAVLRLYVRR